MKKQINKMELEICVGGSNPAGFVANGTKINILNAVAYYGVSHPASSYDLHGQELSEAILRSIPNLHVIAQTVPGAH